MEQWLAEVERRGVPELRALAEGVKKDYEAVLAGLTLEWSNGPTEGFVNKLKLTQRLMYGRAGFGLLCQRFHEAGVSRLGGAGANGSVSLEPGAPEPGMFPSFSQACHLHSACFPLTGVATSRKLRKNREAMVKFPSHLTARQRVPALRSVPLLERADAWPAPGGQYASAPPYRGWQTH